MLCSSNIARGSNTSSNSRIGAIIGPPPSAGSFFGLSFFRDKLRPTPGEPAPSVGPGVNIAKIDLLEPLRFRFEWEDDERDF